MSHCQFHRFINLSGTDIKGTAEKPREYRRIIYLVRHIASACTKYINAQFLCIRQHHFRNRICHGKDNILFRHRLDCFFMHFFECCRCGSSQKDIRTFYCVRKSSLAIFRINLFRQFLLYTVQSSVIIENPLAVQNRHIFRFDAIFQEQSCNSRACRACAKHNHLGFTDAFFNQTKRAENSSQSRNGGSMLVIMEHRDIHSCFQFIFNIVAFRGREIFQIDAGKRFLQNSNSANYFILVFCIEHNRNGINIAKTFVKGAFAFHDRHSRSRSNIA